jgi:hypothetical protein
MSEAGPASGWNELNLNTVEYHWRCLEHILQSLNLQHYSSNHHQFIINMANKLRIEVTNCFQDNFFASLIQQTSFLMIYFFAQTGHDFFEILRLDNGK